MIVLFGETLKTNAISENEVLYKMFCKEVCKEVLVFLTVIR